MRRLSEYLQSRESPYVPFITLAVALAPLFLCLTATVVLLVANSHDEMPFVGVMCLFSAVALLVAVLPASMVLARLRRRHR